MEILAKRIALLQQSLQPALRQPTLLVYAADHGLSVEGVSAYPREVTAAMVMNFLAGGAAINVFTRLNGLQLKVVDVGVDAELPVHPQLISAKVGRGTGNLLQGPAMSGESLARCLRQSESHVAEIAVAGGNVVGFGEMGIGNTSSAALIMHAVTGLPLTDCVGAGTGVQGEALAHKMMVLQQAVALHGRPESPEEILCAYGGFEIAHMAGGMVAAAQRRMVVLVDGFIATAAYAVAVRMEPRLREAAFFCHTSGEKGHRAFLQALEAEPLLDLGLRLGEGTGCALAYPLLKAAVAFLCEMASFADAGIPGGGHA